MSGMWDAFKDHSIESDLVENAIRSTEQEIFSDALGLDPEDNDYDDSLEQLEDFDGTARSDDDWMRELAGEPTDADELRAENEQLRQRIAELTPEPQRPDPFADPEAWEQNILAQHRGGGIPINAGPSPYAKPDMFADPEGYERYLLAEMDRRSGVAEHHEQRINASMAHAHQTHGAEWENAWNDILSLPRDARTAQIVKGIIDSPDPGSAVLSTWAAIKGANIAAQRFGGAPFAPMMASSVRRSTNHAARSKGLYYEAPTTREEAEEEEIFNAAWD
jgi:hypothetical protein